MAVLNSLQVTLTNVPDWVHVIIIAATSGIVAYLNRSAVVPASRIYEKGNRDGYGN